MRSDYVRTIHENSISTRPVCPWLPESRGDAWRFLCWLVGHRWHVVSMNYSKAAALAHLHTVAGCAAACDRCGELWDDSRWFWEEHA